MVFGPKIVAGQKQSLTVSAQVIQSTKLLQYGQQDLGDFLRDQAERNPLIEVVEPGTAGKRSAAATTPLSPAGNTTGFSTKNLAGRSGRGGSSVAAGRETSCNLEEFVSRHETLQEYLRGQVAMTFKAPDDLAIAYEIIESIEPDGYLRRELAEIAEFHDVDESRIDAVLAKVQRFHPTGVGARTLAECLKLQLLEKEEMTPAMQMLLDNLPALANHDIQYLSRRCRVAPDKVLEMAAQIRSLDPKPGSQFDYQPVQPALPDVYLLRNSSGGYRVELNTNLLPRLLVDREYYSEIRRGAKGTPAARYVSDCARSASWLLRNLEKRAETILKVASEVVLRQQDFFLHGTAHLKPLNLQDVADTVGLHSSTVCRAIANKYMMTDRGMFEFKFFFANSVGSAEGTDEHSSESIRLRIRQLISAETEATVLSDDALVSALKSAGVEIARRTVAKYREMMNIPSSNVRKRQRRTIETGSRSSWHADCSSKVELAASAV